MWFGKESWFGKPSSKPTTGQLSEKHQNSINTVGHGHQSLLESRDENTRLLVDAVSSSIHNDPLHNDSADASIPLSQQTAGTFRYWCMALVRCVSIVYIVLGLIAFAMGFFWRTRSFISLLGPISCLCIVLVASEYYHARRTRQCEQCSRNWLTRQTRITENTYKYNFSIICFVNIIILLYNIHCDMDCFWKLVVR